MKKIFTPLMFSILLSSLLSACNTSPATSSLQSDKAIAEPDVRIPDYLATACDNVWRTETQSAVSNPLYWLRAIDCGERLSPEAARAEAHRWPVEGWARAFKQGILLSNGNVTPGERRDYVTALDSYSSAYPAPVRPLLQLWRSQQASQLALSETRTRFVHQQQTSDGELDSLRQQQRQLRAQLNDTQHKLERLTDIERQLSSRKTPDVSDTTHPTATQEVP